MDNSKQTELRRVQLTELDILRIIDKICKDNDIKYSLCGGTLLGAVRHKGYIPWDDDLDIAMRRSDYERFIEVWNKLKPEGYILQNKDVEPNFPQSFAKIRKDHTTFLQFEWERGLFHTGIFVDIFPFDRTPNKGLRKMLFNIKGIKYLIYIRENNHSIGSGITKTIVSALLRVTSKDSRRKYCSKYLDLLKEYDNDRSLNYISVDSPNSIKKVFSPSLCDEYTTLEFEGEQFMCFKNWENYLSVFYGDYMQLPPVEERTWTHHPIIIDFEHNYEELGNK